MIYVLQFSKPLGNPYNPRGTARFYVGYCEDGRLQARLAEHHNGGGAAITRAALERGITFEVVLTLPGDRNEERRLKRQKNTPRLVARHLAQEDKRRVPRKAAPMSS